MRVVDKRRRWGRYNPLPNPTIPKMEEEQLVPVDMLNEYDGIWDFKEDEKNLVEEDMCSAFGMDFTKLGECDLHLHLRLPVKDEEEKLKEESAEGAEMSNAGQWGVRDEEEKSMTSLSLSLNYQQVMDAWSNQGSHWAPPVYSNNCIEEEVPEMHGREARVMRYKEKRQSRVLSKKIRYQVRKINADKRPRIKGRFVKG